MDEGYPEAFFDKLSDGIWYRGKDEVKGAAVMRP
jgi:hypothetical protein